MELKNRQIKKVIFFYIIIFYTHICSASAIDFWFVKTRMQLDAISDNENILLIASTGRSGSTMLYETLLNQTTFIVLKTHLLPPDPSFQGKIIFIFSNPDLAAESALYLALRIPVFGIQHFDHMENSDHTWLDQIQDSTHQTISHNLLCYDALGCGQHLSIWLQEKTSPSNIEEAQILAIKYEHLWEESTIAAIKSFLFLDVLELPKKRARGYQPDQLTQEESNFRSAYNLGTFESPRYAAYDEARVLWEAAPPFQFLKIVK